MIQLGMELALENERESVKREHKRQLDAFLRAFPRQRFTADDLRDWWDSTGTPKPHHPGVYGALLRQAQETGLIVNTDIYVPSLRPSRKGSKIPVYRRGR